MSDKNEGTEVARVTVILTDYGDKMGLHVDRPNADAMKAVGMLATAQNIILNDPDGAW